MDAPLILIITPALGAVVAAIAGLLSTVLRRWLAVVTLVANLFLALGLLGGAAPREMEFGEAALAEWQVVLTLRGDALSGLLLAALAVALLIIAYATATTGERSGRGDRSATLLLLAAAANGVLLAGDLLALYSFAVLASLLLSFLLLGDPQAAGQRAGFKLFASIEAAGLTLALAIVLTLEKGGALDLAAEPTLPMLGLAGSAVVLGAAARAGLTPLHRWLTEATVRADWHGAAVASVLGGALGVVVLLRLGGRTGLGSALELLLLLTGGATVLFAGYLVRRPHGVRHVIAALVLAQGGFGALALGAGNALGVEAAVAQLVVALVSVPLPFVALRLLPGSDDGGGFALAKEVARRPLAGLALAAALLWLAGMPPGYGFQARVLLVQALLAGGGPGHLLAALVVVVASGVLVAGVLRLLAPVFSSAEVAGAKGWWEGRQGGLAPLLLAAVPVLALAVAPLSWHGALVMPALRAASGLAHTGQEAGLWLSALALLVATSIGARRLLTGEEERAAMPAKPPEAGGGLAARVERWEEAGHLDPYQWAAALVGSLGWLVAGVLGRLLNRLAI